MDGNYLRLESVVFEDWGASRINGKLDVDQRTLICGADSDAFNEILNAIRRRLGLVEEALILRVSLGCDWARSGNATLCFACGCSLRLKADRSEFKERMKRDGYEDREFEEQEAKTGAFLSTTALTELLSAKALEDLGDCRRDAPRPLDWSATEASATKLGEAGAQVWRRRVGRFCGIRRTCVLRVDKERDARSRGAYRSRNRRERVSKRRDVGVASVERF